jgi:hypothetical protein
VGRNTVSRQDRGFLNAFVLGFGGSDEKARVHIGDCMAACSARAAVGVRCSQLRVGRVDRTSACRVPAGPAGAGYVEGKNIAIEYRFE